MSRALWFVAGASAGVYAMNKARIMANSLTAEGLRARWQGVQHGAKLIAQDAKQAQMDREVELRERLGLPAVAPNATRQLTSSLHEAESVPASPDHPQVLPPQENHEKDTI